MGGRPQRIFTQCEVPPIALPGMGADPRLKDLFVELDLMPPHRFDAAAAFRLRPA